MTRVGVIDVGTNSIRLLVAGVTPAAQVEVLYRTMTITRLGEGIGKGWLLPQAIDRTVKVLRDYLKIIKNWQVEKIIAGATSAVREAGNREEFLNLVYEQTGLEVQVLSGEEEARYSYQGVLSSLYLDPASSVVVDIGGGSTEFIWQHQARVCCHSVNAGAVRMTENVYTDEQISSLMAPVLDEISKITPQVLVGVGGTVTTLAAMSQSLRVYNPDLVHGYTLSLGEVERLLAVLEATPLEQRRRLPGLQPERADVIPAGARIVRLILLGVGLPALQVSEADIMYGLALEATEIVRRKHK